MNEIAIRKTENLGRIPDAIDLVRVGQWYWCERIKKWEGLDETIERDLYCVYKVGSNFVGFTKNMHSGTTGFRLLFDEFEEKCTREKNWKAHLDNKMKQIQSQIRENINLLMREGEKLSLIAQKVEADRQNHKGSLLPAIATINPEKHKKALVEFRDERMPAIQEEIAELSKDFATTSKDLALPDIVRLQEIKKSLEVIEDRIFTIELYCGLQETVHQIATGDPASAETPICIRQQLLFMDEETLFDYNDGGMDFKKLEDFDKWIVDPKNLNRLLPEQKGIVAFRVRRHKKDYGTPSDLIGAWIQFQKAAYNMETYLLIRNGENVYRIASAIQFSPRLVPFRDEIGEKQFKKVDRWDKDAEPEIITPDDVRYDEHVNKVDTLIKKYNRIFIFIQGLLDRSTVFHPHSRIKLNRPEHMDLWIKCVRDEEVGLPNKIVTWEEYRDQINKTIRRGNLVYSSWFPDDYGSYSSRHNYTNYTSQEQAVVDRPRVCKVTGIRRDRSEVRISWTAEYYRYGYYDYNSYHRRWVDGGDTTRTRHLWIPMKEVFNINGYNLGDYKMFLCDRSLRGSYLEWAPQLLTSEDLARKK